ncbi:MAG: very short patch repair endonuclease [Bacteroidales bacterium]|nr:very short patch repair endonuclease [Bacteroidales bacterium]
MSDKLTPEQRHQNMAAIRGKDTKPEIIVRKYLWSHGFRYRLNYSRLPGKPDIVLRKYRTCVFVNGCFWHGHGLASLEVKSEELKVKSDGMEAEREEEEVKSVNYTSLRSSECCKIPKSNTEFWVKKMLRNKERDKEVQQKLSTMGWHSITLWECQLKPAVREQTLASLAFTLNRIFLDQHKVKRYDMPDESLAMVAEDAAD